MERTVPELPTNNTDLMPSERTKQLKMKNKDKQTRKQKHTIQQFHLVTLRFLFFCLKQKEYKPSLNHIDIDSSIKPLPPYNPSSPVFLQNKSEYGGRIPPSPR